MRVRAGELGFVRRRKDALGWRPVVPSFDCGSGLGSLKEVDVIRVLVFIGALLVCAPAIFAKLRENQHKDRKFSIDLDSAEETIRAFQRRRKRATLYFVLGVCGAATMLFLPRPSGILSLFFGVIGLVAFYATYCCPICYSMVVGADKEDGVELMPVVCSECDAPLSRKWFANRRNGNKS